MPLSFPDTDTSKNAPRFAPLLGVRNETGTELRLEMWEDGDGVWTHVIPRIPSDGWGGQRNTPLWIPKGRILRLVRDEDGSEIKRLDFWCEDSKEITATRSS